MVYAEKIILIFYIQTSGLSRSQAEQLLDNVTKYVQNEAILPYVIATDSPTHVECINPKVVTADEYAHYKTILDKYDELLKKYQITHSFTSEIPFVANEHELKFIKYFDRCYKNGMVGDDIRKNLDYLNRYFIEVNNKRNIFELFESWLNQ